MSNIVSHSGIVERVDRETVIVRILQTSACAACQVASFCHASESKEKLVHVRCSNSSDYHAGQNVTVTASRKVANQALLFAFTIPFFVVVVVLVTVLQITGQEGVSALSALGALAVYYLVLWLFRPQIDRQVSFDIKK